MQGNTQARFRSALDDEATVVHPALMYGVSPANPERVMVRLADGVEVGVKRQNYELIMQRQYWVQ